MSAWTPVTVRVLTAADAAQVFELRRECLTQSIGFHWRDTSRLRWGEADESGVVLGVIAANGELLASRRTNRFDSVPACEDFLEVSLAGVPHSLPLLPMSRTVTRPDVANHRLNALLTWMNWLLFPRSPRGTIIGSTYRAAPFLALAERAGYTLHACAASWDSEAEAIDPVIAALQVSELPQAVAVYAESARGYKLGWRADFGDIVAALARLAAPSETAVRPSPRPVTRVASARPLA